MYRVFTHYSREVGEVHGHRDRLGPEAILGLSALTARAPDGERGRDHVWNCGLIHRGQSGDVGQEMTAMLQSLKHRGPDSTGYALMASPTARSWSSA